jgi:hypothetical protein
MNGGRYFGFNNVKRILGEIVTYGCGYASLSFDMPVCPPACSRAELIFVKFDIGIFFFFFCKNVSTPTATYTNFYTFFSTNILIVTM